MTIKIVADDAKAVVLTREQLPAALEACGRAVTPWGWQAWVETYPEEAEDGSLNLFRIVMGPEVTTHPSYYFIRFYGGPEAGSYHAPELLLHPLLRRAGRMTQEEFRKLKP